jgi:hypothetical protein
MTYVASAVSGIVIAIELTLLRLPGDPNDKRRAIAEALGALRRANLTTLQLLLLSSLALVVAYLLGVAAQALIFILRDRIPRLVRIVRKKMHHNQAVGEAIDRAAQYGSEARQHLLERYKEDAVEKLIAPHPIKASLDCPSELYRASEYSAFWLQRNVPDYPQSSLLSPVFCLYGAIPPILLAPFVINGMRYRFGILSNLPVGIVIAVALSVWLSLKANRMVDRIPTLLFQLFVAYALLAEHSPAQALSVGGQSGDQGSQTSRATTG